MVKEQSQYQNISVTIFRKNNDEMMSSPLVANAPNFNNVHRRDIPDNVTRKRVDVSVRAWFPSYAH